MSDYSSKKYWEDRYSSQKNQTFDWLIDYSSLKNVIDKLSIQKESHILNIGCGNSEFGENLHSDGFTHIYNIDFCPNVISFMKERNKEKNGLHFQEMDVRYMKFKDEIFDIIIDKCTLDSLLYGSHSFINVAKMMKEISRVLKTGGYYLVISYGKPENRLLHFERKFLGYDIKIYTITKKQEGKEDKICYGYLCKKLISANVNIKNYDEVLRSLEIEEHKEEIMKNKEISKIEDNKICENQNNDIQNNDSIINDNKN